MTYSRRDRIVICAVDLVLKLGSPRLRARIGVALRRAQGLHVPAGMLERADFSQERYP